ncbi:hypothetical protein M885DRAFT_299727 [Pelagophyceae sp. CCMP2097]|nr:hypothetical protein M885DRAFT_299727 [Pelagophyceae sp. CCMP2097]
MLRRLLLRRAPPRGAALGRCLSDVSDEAPATRPRSESAAAKVKRSDMGRIAVGIGEGHRMKAGVKTCMGCGVEVVGGLSGLATGSKAMEVTAATKKKKASFSDITDGGKMCSRCSALKKGDVWSAYDALRDVGPEVFKKQLEYIVQRRRFGLCVYVVDAADFEGSVVAGLRNLIKGIPIILAITKTDLLPRISDSDIKYLKHRFEQRCTKVQAVHALAFDPANNTYMNENLVSLGEDVLDILGGRDVFVVGAANVGKSTLVKNLSRSVAGWLAHLSKRIAGSFPSFR